MNATSYLFRDRRHAGRLLASALGRYAGRHDLIVLALPRGGVSVAFEVARALNAPLDVIVVRKLGLPGSDELAMGAVSCGGVRILNEDLVRLAGITQTQIEAVASRELRKLHRREIAYRGCTGPPPVAEKTVNFIDDGIATGSSLEAAIRVVRAEEPAAIVVAVPVSSPEAAELLKPSVDEFVALNIPADFAAAGQWYEVFEQQRCDCHEATG